MKRISPIRLRRTDAPALMELKTNLQDVQESLSCAYTAFDYASDPELTEACIFEIRALQSRMNYLVRQIKALESRAVTAHAGGRSRWT